MSLNINSSKEEVVQFLKSKFNLNEKALSKISDEDINGEALTLLQKEDYKFLEIKFSERNKIKSIIEKDILKLNDNIKRNNIYKYIFEQDLNNLWDSLDNFISKLKLGEKLRFIKYLLIRDPPPEKEKKDDLSEYFKKVFKEEGYVKLIIESLEDLLTYNVDQLEEQCVDWEFSNNDILKLRIIVELMKQNKNKFKNLKKEDNMISKDILTDQNEENKISLNNSKRKLKKINRNNEVPLNLLGLGLINSSNSIEDKHVIYLLIKIHQYETSEGEVTSGLINPIEEFEKICQDFEIKFQNECSFIDYNKAKEIKLSTFMLWGSKESLFQFFKDNNIKEAFDYFNKNIANKKTTGIYLCININKKIGYVIIWPGNLDYQYSKIDEPNDNILLTLIRYGFYLSSNSIICLTKNEIDTFNFNGAEIFEEAWRSGYGIEKRKIIINEINEKMFNLSDKLVIKGLDEILNHKKIINGKINQNNILLFEEKEETLNSQNKKTDILDLIRLYSNYDLYFENNFNISYNNFYLLIRENPCYLSQKNEEKNIIYSDLYLKDVIKEKLNKKIDELFKQMNKELFDIDKYEKEICCKYCSKNQEKNSSELYYIKDDEEQFFHDSCYLKSNKNKAKYKLKKLNKNEYIDFKKYQSYIDLKENIIRRSGNIIDKIEEFFKNCECKFKRVSLVNDKSSNICDYILIVEQNIIQDEIENLRNSTFNSFLNNELKKEDLIENELKKSQEFYKLNENIINKKYSEWMNNWKIKINNYYKNNSKIIKKWVNLKSSENKNNNSSKTYLIYEIKEIMPQKIVTNLYQIKPYKDSSEFSLMFSEELGEINKIENYFTYENKGFIIYKNGEKLKMKIKGKKYGEFEGLYDFDNFSGTLVLFKEENKEYKMGIYYGNGECKSICCNYFISENTIVNKIMLIPCFPGYEKQSLLLFLDKQIQVIKLKDSSIYPKILDLSKFDFKDFREFQFIIYLDFLLILKFNKKKDEWIGKVFSLCLEDESLFNMIKEIKLEKMRENAKFSLGEIKGKIYLFSITILEGKIPLINYWRVDSKLSGISTEYQIKGKKQNIKSEKIPIGNCIVNYFYHCFEKYPLLGAIEYYFKRYKKKKLKIGFFVEKDYNNRINDLISYLEELKKSCENKKKISFGDINLSFFDEEKNNFERNETTIGNLLIKFLEVTPIQIAKIMENGFMIMSNGEKIDEKVSIETKKRNIQNKSIKINITDYSNMINFCIKDSIFNYFELPVIVICCFGTQSIGKSTFLNELTGSLFNVSGMRCTEGIWMSIKLFLNSIEKKNINCNGICSICRKNKCFLLMHEMGKNGINCICQNCKCDKDCLLKEKNNFNKEVINCDEKCCLKKDHENQIKCSFKGCKCKCLCECICEKNNNHQHFCFECKRTNRSFCECDCNCKHLCKIPILLHNFLCVCLDFEGLGTFERSNEQDIQMALIGAAIGNCVIFRTGNSFDRFTEKTLEKLALGSNKLKSINIEQFFGGSLFFSPKDVLPTDKEKLKKEFNQKIESSLKKWNYSINLPKTEKKKYSIFGLFEDNAFAPTPLYLDIAFYKTLRDYLIPEIVENTFKVQRHPIYKTGKEFCSNLKLFLSAIYMNQFEFLNNRKEETIKAYINENRDKAIQVCGTYDDFSDDVKIKIKEINKLKLFLDEENLDKLEIDFSYNTKFENDINLIINNINSSKDIEGNYEIENYGIKFDVKKENNNLYSISIKNLNDFGLILMIPKEIKKYINYKNLCADYFNLWDAIFNKIGFNEEETISYFNSFISSIISRRNNNVSRWIKEMTNNYNSLKELQKQYSPLDDIWKICNEKCKNCYYKCCLLQGHEKQHECPYNHKCKEKCSICIKCECTEKKCEHICYNKSGHPDAHKCLHMHQCMENCSLKDFSIDCKGRCNLEYGHEKDHECGLKIHHCKEKCYLNGKSKNCKELCNLPFPHEGKEHNCGQVHFCLNDCYFKDKSIGCKGSCKFEYGHKEKHDCGGDHYCKEFCYLNNIAKNCGEKCILQYPHEGDHDCGKKHYCSKLCYFKDKSNGCKGSCKFEYGHKEKHDCGGDHYCKQNCYLKYKSKNCGGKCNLKLPHEGENHFCGKVHYCKRKCSLINNSKNCQEYCCLEYGHENECICNLQKENHLCNKKCRIENDCKNDCILIAGHEGKCLCGKCNCQEPCKYKDCSRNCNEKCQLKAGHSETEHKCDISFHYCKFQCSFQGRSKNCNEFCFLKANHLERQHICNIPQRKHICNNQCYLCLHSRNCNKACSLEVDHEGNHICKISSNDHLCNKICNLYQISKTCNELCIKPANHKDNHMCSLGILNHICKNNCSLYEKSREGCKINCSLLAGHKGKCLCSNSEAKHKCKFVCKLYEKSIGCKKYCKLPLAHKGNHLCNVPESQHLCKKDCSLIRKGNCINNGKCCLSYGHKGDCICNKNQHFCQRQCSLYSKVKNGCNKYCSLLFGHDGDHLCNNSISLHICPNKCYYFNKSKGICNEFCSLSYGHIKKCICKNPNNHLCDKECSLFGKAGGCNVDCSLMYEHKGECLCNVRNHTCKEKCDICKEMECGHIYNHNLYNKMKCQKCNNEFCKLSKKGHICSGQHDCQKLCEINGWCQIEDLIKQEKETYQTESGEKINYHIKKFQEIKKKNCTTKITINEFPHETHSCGGSIHKCGVQCLQCEYYCTKEYGHSGLHNCYHGNIKNSVFSVSISNSYAMIRKENKSYKFIEGETAKIFFCDEYCREQGQGHTHLFNSKDKIEENENVRLFKKDNNKFTYECKCSYFWNDILKFKGNFISEEEKKFSLCNWKCKYESHQTPEYCQLPLWHEKVNEIPKDIYGVWIYEGHVFKCIHPHGIYSIFLVDQSGSMASQSEVPNNIQINLRMNNMLGATIQALYNFCKKRAALSPKDKCALIGFNDKANKIFENVSIGEDTILDICLSKLKPDGLTLFETAFKEAKKILDNIDRKELIPIIILLTDGLDKDSQKTINYIKNEVSFFFNFLI